jgi:DNA-binding transcriptional regulator YiaG
MTGHELRSLRLALQVSPSALARQLGVSDSHVWGYEQSRLLTPRIESTCLRALTVLAHRGVAERRRAATETLLAVVNDAGDLPDISAISA